MWGNIYYCSESFNQFLKEKNGDILRHMTRILKGPKKHVRIQARGTDEFKFRRNLLDLKW